MIWNDAFSIDLRAQFKNIIADGKKEPTYLTFFIFDKGVQGSASLGSAGVLLENVRDKGYAEGNFPVVNGTGTLNLSVEAERTRFDWIHSDKAKYAAGAVGIGAVAAGLTALALNQSSKSGKRDKEGDRRREYRVNTNARHDKDDKKKKRLNLSKIPGVRALTGHSSSSSSEDEHDYRGEHRQRRLVYGPTPETYRFSDIHSPYSGLPEGHVERRNNNYVDNFGGSSSRAVSHEQRPWWDTGGEKHDIRSDYAPADQALRSNLGHPSDKYDTADGEKPTSVHIHYHDGASNGLSRRAESGEREEPLQSLYEQRVRVEEPNRTSEYIEHSRTLHEPFDYHLSGKSSEKHSLE